MKDLTPVCCVWFPTPPRPTIGNHHASPQLRRINHACGNRPPASGRHEGHGASLLAFKRKAGVSDQRASEDHQIAPLSYSGDGPAAFARLKSIVSGMQTASVIDSKPGYLYAEYTSKLLGFVDDVEFYLDEKAGVIQVRSASRLGQKDFGVNRARIEAVRAAFAAPPG